MGLLLAGALILFIGVLTGASIVTSAHNRILNFKDKE